MIDSETTHRSGEEVWYKNVPYDVTALVHRRADPAIRWPYPTPIVSALDRGLRLGFHSTEQNLSGTSSERLFDIAMPSLYGSLLVLANAFLTAEAATRQGIAFKTQRRDTLVVDLQNGDYRRVGSYFDTLRARMYADMRGGRLMPLRRAAHVLQKSGFSAVRSDVLCFNPNPLAKAEAASARGIGFRFAWPDSLFAGLPPLREGADARSRELGGLAAAQLKQALSVTGLDLEVPRALEEGFAVAAGQWLSDVASLLASAQLPSKAEQVWTGTGFNTLTRIARARALSDGRHVVGFDHAGGGNQPYEDLTFFRMGELALCHEFVCETPARAEVLRRRLRDEKGGAPRSKFKVRGRRAERGSFAWRDLAPKGDGARKRVLYVPTAFVGERQHPDVPLLPDPIYAAWQARLITAVDRAGFKVLVKPHPEGDMRGRPLLLGDGGEIVSGAFEGVLERADVLLFDYPATTTLWESMCTRLPIVFIDLQQVRFHPTFAAPFRDRATVLEAQYDDRNIPIPPQAALAQALDRTAGSDSYAAAFLVGRERTA